MCYRVGMIEIETLTEQEKDDICDFAHHPAAGAKALRIIDAQAARISELERLFHGGAGGGSVSCGPPVNCVGGGATTSTSSCPQCGSGGGVLRGRSFTCSGCGTVREL